MEESLHLTKSQYDYLMQRIREEEQKLKSESIAFKLLELRKQLLLANLEAVELSENTIRIGDKLTILVGTQEDNYRELNITLVYKNKDAGDISVESPLGLALFGRQVGETVVYQVGDKLIQAKISNKLTYSK